MNQKISVIGAGPFGQAIAQLLAENGHAVTLWCYESEVARTLQLAHVTATNSLPEALQNSIIFEAVPVAHLRTVLLQAQPDVTKNHQWVVLSKGLETETFLLSSEIIKQLFPANTVAVLSGPSYAKEVAAQQPTHVTLAADDNKFAQQIQKLVNNAWFTTELSDDIRGVQLCAAYKNVAAIYLGMLAGAGYGQNAQARALLQCLEEMKQLVQTSTVYGPAGLGDLILTGYGTLSRNRMLGQRLAQGEKLEEILQQLGTTPEGLNTVIALHAWAKKNNLTLAITTMVHEIIFNSKSVADLAVEPSK